MSNANFQDVDVAIFYIDGIPSDYFDDIRQGANQGGLQLREESRENVPYAAMEWVVPTAVAIYIGLKFVDAFLKRASNDVADVIYPKFKAALFSLAKRILITDRDKFTVVRSSPNKTNSPSSQLFSVYSESKLRKRMKFIFHREMSESECEICIDQIFEALREHHIIDSGEDRLSLAISEVADLRSREVYLLFNVDTSRWEIVDPIKEALKKKR